MKFKHDEGNAPFPAMARINASAVRIYFNHGSEQREDPQTGETVTVFTAKYADLSCTENPATALAGIKEVVAAEIAEYDQSEAVNSFTFGGRTMWLDDATRTKLAKRLDVDKKSGLETTKVVYDGIAYELPIAQAEAMLLTLEQYARDCFDKTNEHQAAVNALTTIVAVEAYDYTQGYPAKINFDEMFQGGE